MNASAAPLRVLILEDRPADVDLMLHELRRHGFEVECSRADTESDFLAGLERSPDVILADYTLPQFDALRALAFLQMRNLDIPVIVVTGSVSEEVAVECIKRGAVDYLLKDRLARLGGAVDRALEERRLRDERRRAEQELGFRNLLLASHLEVSLDGTLIVDERGRIILYNQRFVEMWGIPPDVIASGSDERAIQSVLDKLEDPAGFLRTIAYFYEHPREASREEIALKDGRIIDRYSVCMFGTDGRNYGRVWTFRDISERKWAEKAVQSQARMNQAFFNQAITCLALLDGDGRFIQVNEAYARYYGRPIGDFPGRSPGDLFPRDIGLNPHGQSLIDEVKRTLKPLQYFAFPYDFAGQPERGTTYWDSTLQPILDDEGNLEFICVAAIDVTERKHAEEALRQSELKFRTLFEESLDGLFITSPGGKILDINKKGIAILGYDTLEEIGRLDLARDVYVKPPDRERILSMVEAAGSAEYEVDVRKKNGETIRALCTLTAVKDEDGATTAYRGIIRDVTEKKKAEREHVAHLRYFECMDRVNRAIQGTNDLEQMMRDLLDALLSVFDCDRAWLAYPCDPDAGFWRVPVERTRPGYPGAHGLEIPMDPEVARVFRTVLRSSGPVAFGPDSDDVLPSGPSARFQQQSQLSMAVLPKGDKPYMFGLHQCSYPRVWTLEEKRLFQEIGRRLTDGLTSLLTFDSLQRSEEKYRLFFEEDLAGHFISTREGRLLACNPAFARTLGFASVEEAMASNMESLYPGPDERKKFLDRLGSERRLERLGLELRRRDGRPVYVRENALGTFDKKGRLVEIHGFFLDETERRRAEQELRQAQKMDAVGRLAGGVAHDFNNSLTVILGYLELLEPSFSKNDPRRAQLEEVAQAAERAAGLTRQLLAFSRKQVLNPKVLDLNSVVRDLEKMLRRLIGEDIRITTRLAPALGPVLADQGQIEQVILNLAVNARDAMPGGGTLSIETADVDAGRVLAEIGEAAAPVPYVTLSIGDTGCGMNASVMAHIFEPFFTTKEPGKGTGLGLATVFGIVQQSSGLIRVESQPGLGSTFRIFLPRATEESSAPGAVPSTVETIPTGTETILLAEDDHALRALTRKMLTEAGYEVLAAPGPEEALAIAASRPGTIDVLLTDVVMPRMSGPEMARALGEVRPGITIIYMSGYTDDRVLRQGLLKPGIHFIQKPFTQAALLLGVREALERKEPAGA
ncbi:MAG: PAS domain S-box protein [Thermoanaerobaculia bacterium]